MGSRHLGNGLAKVESLFFFCVEGAEQERIRTYRHSDMMPYDVFS